MPARITIFKMNTNYKCWWDYGEKETLLYCWEPLYAMGNILQVSQRTKNRTTMWPRASIPGYISKRNKNFNLKRYMHPRVQNSIIYNCQDMKATIMSINKWIKIVCIMAPHSSTLAWKIPWVEEPGGLQSMGSIRVGHDWATSLSLFHFHALEKEMATHSCVLAWRIAGTGVPSGLTSMVSHRVGHDWSDLAAAYI